MATLEQTLADMKKKFEEDPVSAVRGQGFIKLFHKYIANELRGRLTPQAKRKGIEVIEEAKIFGSYKAKDVDVAVVDPTNGPLMLIGVRSQMSSVGKNVLTYYQDIVGEAISLQERFPMCVTGYAYVHPKTAWNKHTEQWNGTENINHRRYARLYASISDRDDRLYKHQVGAYDHFAYSVIDFTSEPIRIDEAIVESAVPKSEVDLSITTFIDRLVETFAKRNVWMDDVFTSPIAQLDDAAEAGDLEEIED